VFEARDPTSLEESPVLNLDAQKLDHDTYKHLATLGSGSIVILATLVDKLFPSPEWRPLVPFAIASLLASVVGSVFAMFAISYHVDRSAEVAPRWFVGVLVLMSCGGFLGGIASIALFAIKNFL
jgi:hypothetical protein